MCDDIRWWSKAIDYPPETYPEWNTKKFLALFGLPRHEKVHAAMFQILWVGQRGVILGKGAVRRELGV